VRALDLVDGWDVGPVSVAVVSGDGIVAERGDRDAVYPLASVTKLLTAMAVLVAVEERVVDLDAPAGPEGATVRHLLSHASGLGPDGQRSITQPGARRIYSNCGIELAAAEVERNAALPFDVYVDEAVLEPLGMTATSLRGSPAWGGRSTVADLGRFARELLHPTLLAPETLQTATTVAFPGLAGVLPGFGRQTPNDWGLGFELRDHKSPHWTGARNSPRTFGHFGRSGTFFWVDPDARASLVVLTEKPFGQWALAAWPAFSDAVLDDV
jgi:CubicO group peptidase (beta-lactamase class C family)